MAQRKIRRIKRSKTEAPPRPPQRPEVGSKSAAPSTTSRVRNREATEAELKKEYAYVLLDLRRLALIAGAMFILLIVLGLLL